MTTAPRFAYIKAYLAVLVAFALLDGLWLGIIAMGWYQEAFGSLLRSEFITWPWLVFYLVYSAIVVFLAVCPPRRDPLLTVMARGLALGLAAYGTYNLTGYAVIADWPLAMSLIDIAWGSIASALLAITGRAAVR